MNFERRNILLGTRLRSVDDKARTITFVASDETVDRYGDIIRVAGWRLKNYQKNPVFLWSHRSGDPPIGKTVKIWTESEPAALVQTVQFATKAEYPFADTIFNLYRGGFLKAVSVGFVPLVEPKPLIDQKTGEYLGEEHLEQELLELSAVSVPANPNALGRAVSNGIITQEQLRKFEIKAPSDGIFISDDEVFERLMRSIADAKSEEIISTPDELLRAIRS